MSRAALFLRNVASNWAGFAVNALVTLLLTPVVLHTLGASRYGIWILTSSIIGYYGLLDLGFRAGVTQYLTRYLALRDEARASECLSTAFVAFATIGLVVALLSVGAAVMAPTWFDISPEFRSEAVWCILIVGLSSAFQYAFFPFAAIFTAKQRFDIANLIGICSRLLTAAGVFIALKADMGLIGVSVATCGGSLIDYVVRWRVSRVMAPELQVSVRLASRGRLREVFSFGAWNFLISINFYAYHHLPNILIASLMRVAAVGHYSLVTGLATQINAVLNPVAQVLYPAAAGMHARGEHAELERLYHDGSRLMMLVMSTVVLIAGFYADDFYRLWIGESFLSGTPFQSVAFLLRLLLISVVANYVSAIGSQILTGAGHVRAVALALICGSALSLGVGVALMQPFGLAGLAIGTVTASIVIDLVVMPLLLKRFMGFSLWLFVRYACLRPAAVGVLQAAGLYAIRLGSHPQTWLALIIEGVMAGILCVAIILAIGVTRAERERFFFAPLTQTWRKLCTRYQAS
jgi:O-antigen/teichoic acid export membrane protein